MEPTSQNELNSQKPESTDSSHDNDQTVAPGLNNSKVPELPKKKPKSEIVNFLKTKHLNKEEIPTFRSNLGYMGSGVSRDWLASHETDVAKLQANNLPIINSPNELAAALGMSPETMKWLSYDAVISNHRHYSEFTIPKRSGGERLISSPRPLIAKAQRWIFNEIVSKLNVEAQAHGFVAGRSIVSNAEPHCDKRVIINLDLKDFFPSVVLHRVAHIFYMRGYAPSTSMFLALLCTDRPRAQVEIDGKIRYKASGKRGLPQGACTSPGLANQAASILDRRLQGLANRYDLTYTRYADDLTFSSSKALHQNKINWLLKCVKTIAEDENFTVHPKKTSITGNGSSQTVTGLVVNQKPNINRQELRLVRAILHNAQESGLYSQWRDPSISFNKWILSLHGKISFIMMVNREQGLAFQKTFSELMEKDGLNLQELQQGVRTEKRSERSTGNKNK
jgi:RNA-directed DNA polymerase